MVMKPPGYDPNPQNPYPPQWAPTAIPQLTPPSAPRGGSFSLSSVGSHTRISLGLIGGGLLLYLIGIIAAHDRFGDGPWLSTWWFVTLLVLVAAVAGTASVLLDNQYARPGGVLLTVLLIDLIPGTSFLYWLGTALRLKFLVGDSAVEFSKPWSGHALTWAIGSLALLAGAIYGRHGEPSPLGPKSHSGGGPSAFAPKPQWSAPTYPPSPPNYQQPSYQPPEYQQPQQYPQPGYAPQGYQQPQGYQRPPSYQQQQPYQPAAAQPAPPQPARPAQPPTLPQAPNWPAPQHAPETSDDEVDDRTLRREDLPKEF
jgi:hypothetical protein